MKKLLSLVISSVLLSTTLSGISRIDAKAYTETDGDIAIQAFNAKFWDSNAKYFWADSNHGSNYQGFWVEAQLWEMVMDAYLNTKNSDLKAQLRTQIDQIYEGAVVKYGEDWTNNDFNDDIMWWAMACARAYQITEDPKYLDKAKYYFDFVYDNEWDDKFLNGGIWWMNSDHSTKNSCINFPASEAATILYNITRESRYLEAATSIYRWGKTMLTDGNGNVFDRIEVGKGAFPGPTHYNQGTFIGSAVGLYKITGNTIYLDDAVKAANFTKTSLSDSNGMLRFEGGHGDLKGGKTILVRNFANLQKAVSERKEAPYQQFAAEFKLWLANNIETAWNNRNSDNISDGNWAGQLLSGKYESWSSSSIVEALNVIEPQEAKIITPNLRDAYKEIEAEAYDVATGVGIEGCSEGTLQLGGIQPEYYAVYKNVDFGSTGAEGFIARAASGTGGGKVEIRLDSLTGTQVGTLNVQGTGGWSNFTDAAGVITKTTGVHDVYLIFKKTNDQYLFNINWIKFTQNDPTRHDAFTKLKGGNFDEASGLSKDSIWNFINGVHNNSWALFKDIDFGNKEAAGLITHVSSGTQGGTIDVKLDSLDGPVVGTVTVPKLDSNWSTWADILTNIDYNQAKGVHDLYLVFHGVNGSDWPCNLDWFTFTTVRGVARDAFGKLEAENYTSGAGFGTENGAGQTYLAGINSSNNNNKPYAMYNFVDFGTTSPTKFTVNAASPTSGGTIEVRIDNINGPVFANAVVTNTGGWQNFKVFTGDVTTPATGKHIVYLLFKGNDWLYNFDKFTFGDTSVFTAPDQTTTPVQDSVAPGEVENIQIFKNDDKLTLYWDGPYDIDATEVEVTIWHNGEQVGDVINVKRGLQTAGIEGLNKGKSYEIRIRTMDSSGNKSNGIKEKKYQHKVAF